MDPTTLWLWDDIQTSWASLARVRLIPFCILWQEVQLTDQWTLCTFTFLHYNNIGQKSICLITRI